MSGARVYGNIFSGIAGGLVALVTCGLYLHNNTLIGFPCFLLIPILVIRALIADECDETECCDRIAELTAAAKKIT